MKIFISMPMDGKKEEDIKHEMTAIFEEIAEKLSYNVTLLDSLFNDIDTSEVKKNSIGISYLGESISLLAQADLVVFAKEWENARGCKIEHLIAKEYGKLCVEL